MGKNVKLTLIGLYIVILTVLLVIERKVLVGGWNGIIVGNLIASFYWVPFTFFHLDQLQRKHHAEQMMQHKTNKVLINYLYNHHLAGPSNPSVRHFENIANRSWLSTSNGNIAGWLEGQPDWREIDVA